MTDLRLLTFSLFTCTNLVGQSSRPCPNLDAYWSLQARTVRAVREWRDALTNSDHHGLTFISGLEADQKVIAAHGCYAMTATTALTAQNTLGVDDIHEIPAAFVEKQINACASDIGIDVIKTGITKQILQQTRRACIADHKQACWRRLAMSESSPTP